MKIVIFTLFVLFLSFSCGAIAGEMQTQKASDLTITIHAVTADGVGKEIGTITATDTDTGLKLTPNLSGLTPGNHGFHVHDMASCEPGMKDGKQAAAIGAGGHYDPHKSGKHMGPLGEGHMGDLPVLVVGADGKATESVLAPRMKAAALKGHAIMIHAGGDNYADTPDPLGGGGARIACGVVQ